MATAKRDQILQEAEKLASRGKLDAAIREYRRAVDQAPNDTNTLNRLGDLLVRVNRIAEAIEVYQRIADHFSEDGFFLKAIAIYKKINRLDPQRTETYEKLADLYFKQGLVVEGRQQLVTLADWFQRSKQASEAIRVFRRMADLDPGNLQARAKLVDLLVQAGDVSNLPAEIDPLGKALLGRGMLDEAIKLYHRVLELGPRDGGFVAPCVDALVNAGRLVPAKELADLAMRISPPGPDLSRAAARVYADSGDLKAARALLEQALAHAGDRTELVQLYSDVLLRAGEAAVAKETALPVIDRLLAAGDHSRAAGLVKRLLRSTPGDIDVLERGLKAFDKRDDPDMVVTLEAALADAYFRAGRKEVALGLYRQLTRHDPANRLFAERLHALGGAAPPQEPAPPEAPPPAARQTESAPPPPPVSPSVVAPRPPVEPEEVEFIDVDLPLDEAFSSESPGVAAASGVPELAFGPTLPSVAPPAASALTLGAAPSLGVADAGTDESVAGEEALAAEVVASATTAEELYTEAVVFAKYGLTEKAVAHVHRLLALDPDHGGGRELLATLGGEMVEVEFPPAVDTTHPMPLAVEPVVETAAAPVEPEAKLATRAPRARVKLEELEAILGLGGPALGRHAEEAAPRRLEPPEITFEPVDLAALGLAPTAAKSAPAASLDAAFTPAPITATPPEPTAPPEPEGIIEAGAGQAAEAVEAIEILEEPVELVEVGDVLAGPAPDQLREIDFFIEQGLLQEAAGLLRKVRENVGEHPDVVARQALLKARGWEEERVAALAEGSAEELFGEEDRFFDLAAELERELADEEIVAEATGINTPGEVSIEELFREFQKGVAEQLREEDYDTHFNLGIAYREMGLLDEAIREFQLSAKSPELAVEAMSMIGACYLEHGLAEQSAEWYARALATPDLANDVQVGLRYELGRSLEAAGDLEGALASYTAVLAVNPAYRDVVDRIARLKAN